ncbi:hypothetical protein diail_4962 [Diaporthe ilicicola]|nr:hypothetical protein diail_4962 [Diaporthe ilicicola]
MADSCLPSIKTLWGDERFADATVVMGNKTWHVHRWESKDKKINLTGSPFPEADIDDMLRYLYFHELDKHQISNPIAAFVVADYFQVEPLCAILANQLSVGLEELIRKKFWVNFKGWCKRALGKHEGTPLERKVIGILANNIDTVMHESGAWDELTNDFPDLAKKILGELIPNSPSSATNLKRRALVTFNENQLAWSGPPAQVKRRCL